MRYFQEILNIDSYDFDKYKYQLKKRGENIEEIFDVFLSEDTLNSIILGINIANIKKYKIRCKRFLQIFALILLKCENYNCLRKCLKELTNLDEKQIRKLIKKYVPILNFFNERFDCVKYLPRSKIKEYTFQMVINMIQSIGITKTGFPGKLIKPSNLHEFKSLALKYQSSKIPLSVKCNICGKIWNSTPRHLNRGFWCGKCKYADKKLDPTEIHKIGKDKKLKLISSPNDYQNLLSILEWKCVMCGNVFKSNTANIKKSVNPCPSCSKPYQLIEWDNNFENKLINNIKYIVKYLPLDEKFTDMKSFVILKSKELWDSLIRNGLKPKHMKTHKNSVSLAFIIIYYVLLYVGVEKIDGEPISGLCLFRSLGSKIKALGIEKKSQFHTAPKRVYNFLPFEYKDIFNQRARNFKLDYNRIKRFIEENLNETLKSTQKQFVQNKIRDNTTAVDTKIDVGCKNGHIWTISYRLLKWNGRRCPKCAQRKYESIVQSYFEKIFLHYLKISVKFTKTRLVNVIDQTYKNKKILHFIKYSHLDGFNDLKIHDFKRKLIFFIPNAMYKKIYRIKTLSSTNLEILFEQFRMDFEKKGFFEFEDRILIEYPFGFIELRYLKKSFELLQIGLNKKYVEYNEEKCHKIAFEYNGEQHYHYPNFFHKNLYRFLSRISNDLLKMKICIENSIILFVIPYRIKFKTKSPKQIKNYIFDEITNKLHLEHDFDTLCKF